MDSLVFVAKRDLLVYETVIKTIAGCVSPACTEVRKFEILKVEPYFKLGRKSGTEPENFSIMIIYIIKNVGLPVIHSLRSTPI